MSNSTQPGAEDLTPESQDDDTTGHGRARFRDDSEECGETAQDDDTTGHGIPQWPTSESGTRP